MAETLSAPQIGGAMVGRLTSSAGASVTNTDINHASAWQPTVGASAGNVNKAFDTVVTIADSSTPSDLDLTALTDARGNTVNFGTVNAIKVTNNSSTAGQDITIGGGTNPFVASIPLPVYAGTQPGSFTLDLGTTGKATSGTVKTLRLSVAAGTGVTCKLTVFGK